MSFRKRSEVINNGGRDPNGPRPVPNAVPGRRTVVQGRTPIGRAPVSATPIGRAPAPGRIPAPRGPIGSAPVEKSPEVELSNIGIRPSLITSQPTISTGTSDLDKILGHQGLPLGNSLLIQESGTTDFGSILLRCFAAQGIMHNRVSESVNCHVIVVGLSSEWAKDLPGVYKGSSKEKKKAMIQDQQGKINVSNLSSSTTERDMKIAWRYELNKKVQDENLSEVNENYNHQFDITERLRPVPNNTEISFVQLSSDYKQIMANITTVINQQIKQNPSKTIRIIIPNVLIPSLYPPSFSQPCFMVPFFHSLRGLLKRYSNNVALVSTIPIDLYPRTNNLTNTLENLSDAVIHLQPFSQEMSQLIERAYKNEPGKVQHGLVNILKLPVLAERGLMTIHDGEYAFKNGRKKFEIEEWGIPVEDEETEQPSNGSEPPKQTTKNIDF